MGIGASTCLAPCLNFKHHLEIASHVTTWEVKLQSSLFYLGITLRARCGGSNDTIARALIDRNLEAGKPLAETRTY
jgi:hypothetical protein